MRKSIFLPVFIIMIMAAVFSPSALAVVLSDESSPVLSFVDPSPADGAWVNYSNPSIKIEADEELSEAYLQLDLENEEDEGLTMDILEDNKFAEYGLSDLDEGSYTYQVTAYDTVGNKTVSDVRSFRVDTVAPSGHISISPYHHNKETAGDDVLIEVSLRDYDSYVKEVCLWLGDEEENLLDPEFDNCKELSEKTWNSNNYAPGFNFRNWDSSKVADGSYNLYAIAADNAGNEAKIFLFVKLNNHSEGSAENPSEISTCEEFQAINDNLNWHYKLINDIDCSETKNWNNGDGLKSIGDSSNTFTGIVDGQNYHIYDIVQKTYNSRVFESNGGIIKNLNLRNVKIECSGSYCSGMVGVNSGDIESSSITGNLTCVGSHCSAAAITHQNSGLISETWADMDLAGSGFGLVTQQSRGQVKNSYFRGNVSSGSSGLVGTHAEHSDIFNSYSVADFRDRGTGIVVGGLISFHHYYNTITVANSFWDAEYSNVSRMCASNERGSSNCTDENGLTTDEMKTADSFESWDFETIWAIDPEKNDGYPYLQWQTTFSEKDVNKPIITLNGEAELDIYVGEEYSDEGATAEDDVDGDISAEIVINNPVNTSAAGSYIITYNVSDEAGNEAEEKIRTVNVVVKPTAPAPSSSSSRGGSSVFFESQPTPTVFQTYDPNTGVLTEEGDNAGEKKDGGEEEEEEEIRVLGVEMDFYDIDNLYGYPSDVVDAVSGDEAEIVFNSNDSIEMEEDISEINNKIVSESDLSEDELMSIAFFIQYGTKTTKRLGAGERAGVVDSFKSAYGRLPKSLSDWQDIIKVANGRWPEARNEEREAAVKREFEKIYQREADMENDFDETAIMIMAYGLRPANRNMESEKKAILIFEDIFGQYPKKASDWDAVRAIAYSGAER